MVNTALNRGIFSKEMYDKYQILTSRGIQERYAEALKRRSKIFLENAYLLLKSPSNVVNVAETEVNVAETRINVDNNATKKSKVNKSKKNKMIGAELQSSPCPDTVYELQLLDGSFYPVSRDSVEKYGQLYPAVDVDQEFRKMIGWLDSHPKNRKTARGIDKFINGWLSRTQDSARPQDTPKTGPKNRFHNFTQSDTDYDAIALERVRSQLTGEGR